MKDQKTKKLTVLAMLCALSYATTFLFHFIGLSFIPALPFLTYDPKDIIIVIGGFLYGPLASLAISAVVSTLEMLTISSTGPIGLAMNILSSCAFACTAAWIYQKKRTLLGASLGLLTGVTSMVAVMLAWNYVLTPLYMEGATREYIATLLVPAFLPFNLLKGAINASFTALLYRPLVLSLRKAGLFPTKDSSSAPTQESKLLFYGITGLLIVLSVCAIFLIQHFAS